MRKVVVSLSEEYYQMCYDLYNQTDMHKHYTWEEAMTYMCTYGIVATYNFLLDAQAHNIYEVEEAHRIGFDIKENKNRI